MENIKRSLALLVLCAVVFFTPALAFADNGGVHFVDNASLLSSTDAGMLNDYLQEISDRQEFDVSVVTVNGLEGKTIEAYADDYYDYNGFGYGKDDDGALLLIDMDSREFWITTHSFGITALTDYGIDYIKEKITPYLKDGDYYQAFKTYGDICDDFVTKAVEGEPVDVGYDDGIRDPFDWLTNLAIALGLGGVVGFGSSTLKKSSLKTVRSKPDAHDYTRPGSMNVRESRDLYLYSAISRTAKPDDNDSGGGSTTHTSSSGRIHGGGGGSF